MANDTIDAYLRTQVLTASPEQLRLLLLDGAIRFACQGRDGLIRKDYEAVFSGFSQSRDIVLELATTVKNEPDPELAARVRSIYLFIYQQLVSASFERDAALANKAIELLEYERETWSMLIEQLGRERSGQIPGVSADTAPIAGSIGRLSLQA